MIIAMSSVIIVIAYAITTMFSGATGASFVISFIAGVIFLMILVGSVYLIFEEASIHDKSSSGAKSVGVKNKGIEIFDEEDNVDLSSFK